MPWMGGRPLGAGSYGIRSAWGGRMTSRSDSVPRSLEFEVAALASEFYRAAGTHIGAPCPEMQVAMEGARSDLVWLGAASALHNLLLRSAAGRKALADLGCEVGLHQVDGE